MAGRQPPRFVPTLTEVVQGAPGAEGAPAQPSTAAPEPAMPAPEPPITQEELARRVLAHVDAALERRLHEALAAALMEQTRVLAPILRAEIEALVRHAVAEAFEHEFRRSPPA